MLFVGERRRQQKWFFHDGTGWKNAEVYTDWNWRCNVLYRTLTAIPAIRPNKCPSQETPFLPGKMDKKIPAK